MNRVCVNVTRLTNTKAAKKTKLNGRDVIVVPSATLPDDIVMNGIRYPAEEIEASFTTLNRTPAPFGHPTINGKFVSASDPEGINLGYIGAWNDNARRENGRVFIDKIIDVEIANQSQNGRDVLAAIEAGEPIHTSTGLFCSLEETDEEGIRGNARGIVFDHDAILLNEEGAATPEQGVGMLVNSKGEEFEVVNSRYDYADEDLEWAVDAAARALETKAREPMLQRLKSALIEAFEGSERTNSGKQKEAEVNKEQFDSLSATVNTLKDGQAELQNTLSGLGEIVANAIKEAMKPVIEANEQAVANAAAEAEAKKTELVNKVVKANILDEEAAKELGVNTLQGLIDRHKPKTADGLSAVNSLDFGGDKDEFEGYSLNSHLEEQK